MKNGLQTIRVPLSVEWGILIFPNKVEMWTQEKSNCKVRTVRLAQEASCPPIIRVNPWRRATSGPGFSWKASLIRYAVKAYVSDSDDMPNHIRSVYVLCLESWLSSEGGVTMGTGGETERCQRKARNGELRIVPISTSE